jgi:23S rRNA (guanosine2251-2'-O)-methyltransferase
MNDNWIWGVHSIEACLETRPELIKELFTIIADNDNRELIKIKELAKSQGISVQLVKNIPGSLKDRRTQGIFAQLQNFPVWNFREEKASIAEQFTNDRGQWAMLDRIQDPQNYGAVLRSAAAFGVKGIFVANRDQCPANGTVAQVSAGQLFRIPLYECEQCMELLKLAQEKNVCILSLDSRGENLSRYLSENKSNILWILGAEHQGVQKKYLEQSDSIVSIPMNPDVESLNVSNAAAIAFYETQKNIKTH